MWQWVCWELFLLKILIWFILFGEFTVLNGLYHFFVRDNEIECVLFGDCATESYLHYKQHHEVNVVDVINFARLSWIDQGNVSNN